jgi:hypothetical protein
LAPVFGGLWLGAGLGWPYYSYPYESYYGSGPYTQYWYCDNPEGITPTYSNAIPAGKRFPPTDVSACRASLGGLAR